MKIYRIYRTALGGTNKVTITTSNTGNIKIIETKTDRKSKTWYGKTITSLHL